MDYQEFVLFLKVWFLERGLKIIIILFAAWIATKISKVFVSRIIITLVKENNKTVGDGRLQRKRIDTLVKVFYSTLKVIIWIVAILTILPEVNINIAPLLAGAGLVGLTIGMGARNIIQDYLSGLFILLEDQYRIGEEVDIAGIKGEVVDLNLRRTVLKDSESTVHHIPNGQIKSASNFSRK